MKTIKAFLESKYSVGDFLNALTNTVLILLFTAMFMIMAVSIIKGMIGGERVVTYKIVDVEECDGSNIYVVVEEETGYTNFITIDEETITKEISRMKEIR